MVKNNGSLGENYVLKTTDFTSYGIYKIGSLATSPSGNAPSENVGDFNAFVPYNNPSYQLILLFSPRLQNTFYIGHFWEGKWDGWKKVQGT